ncbi:MAG: site-specific recombinase [Pseudomonadota bacterium]
MLALIENIDPESTDIKHLIEIVDLLRPKNPADSASASSNVRTLCQLLKGNPEHAWAMRQYFLHILASRRHTSLYTDLGILSNDGFFSELMQRISYRILPPALGVDYLSDALDQILYVKTDYQWISAVPARDWLALFDTLALVDKTQFNASFDDSKEIDCQIAVADMLEAIRTLSYRICAIGLEPRLTLIHPEIEKFESPFITQNVEVNAYLNGYQQVLDGDAHESEDARHILVMLDQCEEIVGKIRKNALYQGTSISLTYLLVVLTQSIARLRKLLFLIDVTGNLPELVDVSAVLASPAEISSVTPPVTPSAIPSETQPDETRPASSNSGDEQSISPRRLAAVALALELIWEHNNKYAVGDLISDNLDLLARNVTENASRTGEHYIADNRQDYGAMFLSSAGAGFIIGFMALLKILASYLRSAPLIEAFLYSLNYSLGFMLIHVLHFTVATKQPAMTASRIAAGLHSQDGSHIDIDSMAELIIKVLRTQFIAIMGNLITVIPTAYLIAVSYAAISGEQLVSVEKAQHLLHDIDPFTSLALFHAMIAGVCLFLAGLISGYYDNQALYTRLGQRISQLRRLGKMLGQERLQRFGLYIENNLGGLMGNFYFGILLGTIGTLGNLLGIPVDIRHITFSASNFATAVVGLNYHVSWQLLSISLFGILSVGAVNLLVSFGLALMVALRSRQVRFNQRSLLLKALALRFWRKPADFFIAPKDDEEAESISAEESKKEPSLD